MKRSKLAKVTLTITDKPGGRFSVTADFDPPIQRDEPATSAQLAACAAIDAISELAKEHAS